MPALTANDLARLGTIRPELMAKLTQLVARMSDAGYTVTVPDHGGFRSHATQSALYADSLEQGGGVLAYPVATPGNSRHEYGAAFDLNIAGESAGSFTYAIMAAMGEAIGLTAGYNFTDRDPYHFQLNETLNESVAAWDAAGHGPIAPIAVVLLAAVLWRLAK